MSTTDEVPSRPVGQVSFTTISIKLPTFWRDSPEVWFLQAESQFHHCIAALPQDVANRLIDLVPNPPAEPYASLRSHLVQMYTMSNFQRYQGLQSISGSTNQRLLELMDKMLVLLPEDEKPAVSSS